MFMIVSFYNTNSSSKLSLSYGKRVPQLLDIASSFVLDKNRLLIPINGAFVDVTCSLVHRSQFHMYHTQSVHPMMTITHQMDLYGCKP